MPKYSRLEAFDISLISVKLVFETYSSTFNFGVFVKSQKCRSFGA